MWLVFLKEIKELTRDRKTLFFMIALPILLFPMIFGVVGYFSSKALQDAENKVLKYAIIGAEHAPALAEGLASDEQFALVEVDPSADYAELINAETVEFVLEIPAGFTRDALQDGQSVIKLYLNDAGVNMVQRRVSKLTDDASQQLQQAAFTTLGLSDNQKTALLEPVVLEKVNVADQRENWGERIGGLVPYIIFILCLQGAMFPATDLGAGEKERGTLETLLISPIERHKLVLGKFFTIAFAGVVAALITVSSMAIWGMVLSQGMAIEMVAEFMGAISALDFILMFLMLVPVVSIFASVLLSLSIYARSFKEAQSYMGSLVIFVIVPIILAMLPGVELEDGWAWVPLTNVALAIKELIKGTMDYVQLVGIFGSTALIAGALIAFCVHWFNKEKVLFR
ncbi:ABC transporter permease [Aestuariibacter halophilus]|uniref:ABC transporter permease n=1 Tax=Fluctibacter halophilus TaxID=226011 RepID=A0ABS8G8D5_9ALTE|nr:ABC transporter permease [Aestuariibacter halophilus]MCC2616837.1 ABC transporter permease [Aestuariibacter halophilus]